MASARPDKRKAFDHHRVLDAGDDALPDIDIC
jgi:hypothetical protein